MVSVVAGNPWDVLKVGRTVFLSVILFRSNVRLTCLKVRYQRGKAVKGTTTVSGDPRTVMALVRREGLFRGLYAGFWPNVFRNSIVGSSEMVAYSQCKRLLVTNLEMGENNSSTHLASAFGAGLTAALLGSPMVS